ncbi:hypothetical protein TVAG_316220 [Trichomonas vaginalis G3]|uniref:Cell cycle control protein n=1 Tax=Trichomonas vaginalis (strain ATCC PRA-98 / G3) TaxID=412133 RepID=A2FAY0_TRIV3|nr:aminophospholipid transmembrane transporter protein [Trichomonas vaginalis G3]EAX97957.1 hypothetical protein TVAG_316220 [Trichomonas vaginalis G3]KAI5502554.1 aminophospholipid transmembrane transporter protein [Trichomonas vaginalis G3]|eukprot:XP_001310887.1 hypothetical protein [Trichomonas vaginalis G3]
MFSNPNSDPNQLPTQTAFSQQRIDAWRPLFTPAVVVSCLFVLGIIFSGFGIYLYLTFQKQVDVEVRYDDLMNGTDTIVPITVPKAMKGNDIWLFYKLTNFYQNHRRYMYSRSPAQLRGEYVGYNTLKSECDVWTSRGGSSDPKDLYLPCGAIALSFFNDTYQFVDNSITLLDAGISWRSDREKLFRKISSNYTEGIAWLEAMNETGFPNGQRNEHFIVWMRTASLPTFVKPYSRVSNPSIAAGTYYLNITNNYPIETFYGKKYILLTTLSPFGGKNMIYPYSYLVFGGLMFFFSIMILISRIFCSRTLGDTSYVIADPEKFDQFN